MSELLYNALFNEGSYTKSYGDFKSDFATPENQLMLYEALNKEGAYTNSKGDFLNDYFPIIDELEPEVTTVESQTQETQTNVETEIDVETPEYSTSKVFSFLESDDKKEYDINIKNFFNVEEEIAVPQLQSILGDDYEVSESTIDMTRDPKLKKYKKGLIGDLNYNAVKIRHKNTDEEIKVNFGIGDLNYKELAKELYLTDSKKLFDFVDKTMSKEGLSKTEVELQSMLTKYNELNVAPVIGKTGEVIKEPGPLYTSEEEKNEATSGFDAEDLFTPIEKISYKPIGKFGDKVEKQVVTEQPYEDELKIAKQQLISSGTKSPSKKQIQEQAILNLKQTAVQDLYDQKATDYMNSDEVEETDLNAILKLGGLMAQKVNRKTKKDIAENNLKLTNRINSFEKEMEDSNTQIGKALEFSEIASSTEATIFDVSDEEERVTLKNGTIMSKAMYDDYMLSVTAYDNSYKEIEKLQNKLSIDISKVQDEDVKYDLVRRNYNDAEKFLKGVSAGFGDLAVKSAYGFGNITAGLVGVQRKDKEQEFIDWEESSSSLTKIREKFQKDIKFENAFNSKNMGRFLLQETQNQLPIFATLATGNVGIGILGFSSAQENWNRMVQEDEFYGSETSLLNKMLVSGGYGAAEIVFDRYLTLPVMRRSGKSLFGSMKKFREVTKPGMMQYTKQFGKRQLIFDPALETTSEVLTTGFQNIITGRPLTENMGHAAFSGGFFGTAFGHVPFYKGLVMSKFSDYNSYTGFRSNLNKLEDLQITAKKLNTSLKANKTKGNDTSAIEGNIETVNQEIESLQKENESIIKTVDKKVNNLSKKWFNIYNDATVEQEQIRIDVENISKDETLSNDEKKNLIDIKKQRFDNLQKTRDVLRDDKNFGNAYAAFRNSNVKEDQDRLQEIQGQATTELINEGKLEPNDDAIDTRTRIIYNTQEINKDYNSKKSMLQGAGFKNFQTVDQLTNFVNKMDLSDADKQNIISNFEEGAHGVNVVDNNGDIIPMQVVENMAKADRLETRTHEIGHAVFAAAFGNNQEAFNDIADSILEFVKQRNPNLHLRLLNQVERDAKGDLISEEVLTNFLELIAENKINLKSDKNKGLGGFIANILNISTKKSLGENADFNFEGETDAINFLIKLGKKIKAGTLTIKDIKTIERGKIAEKTKEKPKTKFSKPSARAQEFLDSIEEGLITNESLVDIVNSKQSSQDDRFAAVQALIEKNWPIISKSLKFNPTGDITMESIKEAISEQMLGIFPKITLPNGETINREGKRLLDTYNKENTVTTFLDNTLRPRQAEIFTRAKTIDAKSQGVSLDEAKNIAVSTELENATSNQQDTRKRINVLKIPKVAKVAKDIRQDTKVIEGDAHKQVTKNNEGHIGKKIFNIPENKITKPKDNLTTSDDIVSIETGEVITKEELDAGATGILSPSESKSVQDVFADYETSEQFIKILPKTNVSEKDALINEIGENIPVSRNVYGRAIGLQDRILEYFYEPLFKPNGKRARSQGKTSQVPLWTLKEQFINPKKDVVVQFQRDLGITEQQQINILPTKEKRSEIGQLLKGAARTLSQQVSLSAAQRILEARGASPQQIADVTAAQSKKAFSNVVKTKVDDIVDFIVNPDFEGDLASTDSLLKTFIKKGKYKLDSESSINEFYKDVENVLIPALPKGYITKRILRPSGRILGANRDKKIIVNGKKITVDKYYTKKRNDLLSKKDLKYGPPFTGKAVNFKARKYKDVFGNSAKSFEKANKDGKIKEFNEVNQSMHLQLWKRVNESIKKNKNNARIWGSYFSTVSLITEHPHRLGAEFVGWSPKPRGYGNKTYEWEHAMPASRAYLYLLESILDPNFNFDLAYQLVMDNYKLVALDNYVDKTSIKQAGRTTSMGRGWSIISDSWLDRYFKGDIDIDAKTIVGLDGRTFEDIYNIPRLKTNIAKNQMFSKAINKARTISESKGITVLDFDDTLATTKSLVKYTTPDGKTGTLNAEQYASTYEDLLDQGYIFDFSDFNKVVKGKVAPLFQKALKLQKKFGPENMFVLTARPPQAAKAIFDFLKANGLNIPMKNITGLANSTAEAKALWIADKVGEGYNDFYFADDALQNVQAVDNMLEQFDVKRKVQQAKVKFSKDMDGEFNKILEEVTGIELKKRFSDIKARKRGASKGKFRFFIPPSHEDFVGLLYNFMGKGAKGDKHRDFFEQALVRPLNRAYREIDTAKQAIANDYKELNKQFSDVKKKLKKKTPDGDFIFEDAIRVYLWNKHGYDIPGLSPTDRNNLSELVMNDASLRAYAETLNVISKQDTYVDPGQGWEGGNIKTDLIDATGRVGRAQYFAEFNENADIVFSPENLNKIEAAYGRDFRSALEDMLHRISTGVNRPKGQSGTVNAFMNYLNGSVGTVMFFNVRSAILQQMSIVNYINFADNNIFAAAKAFANQKQYWKDFAFIFNSDMLKQRRGGIGTDINGADLAQAVKGSKDPTKVVISRLLQLGFLPTQIGDNIAIATGGATFYRNRVNKYIKDGLSKKEAETKAFTDFQDLTQSTQQSSRPDMTSKQQASWIGKLVLNFQNITSQYNRIIKKAALDIGKGRISPPYTTKAQSNLGNLSKILYYGAIQNVIFYSLQTALFAVMFGDDEDEEQILKKRERVIQGSIDSILRGAGIYGAVLSTLKNAYIRFKEQREKGYNKDESAVPLELLNFSPVIGIKVRQLVNAEKTLNYNENVISEMETFQADNPQWSAVTNYTQALTNFPANRLYQKSINMRNALDKDYTNFQRVMFFSGYTTWSLGLGDTEAVVEAKEKVKINKENARKEKRVQKQIEKIEANKSIVEENKKKKDGICAAISSGGKRCKNKAIKDGFCSIHEKVEQRKDGKQRQCKKYKSDGTRCKMQTTSKSGFCYYHD